MSKNTPFRYDYVGSFLRPEKLKKARRQFNEGKIDAAALKKVEDEAITELVSKIKELGYHVITDGEFRRATWHLDFMWGFDGIGHTPTKTGLPFHGEAAMVDDTYIVGKIGLTGEHPFVDHFRFVKTENDDNGKTTYTPIFREAGIILNVTPEIMKDNSIVLKINLETSDFKMQNYITDDEENDYDGQGGSKVSRNLETTVRMKDGDTVFIGGLKKGIIQNSESRIPFISSVPVVGALFKNSSERKEVTDLYIRLKVDIVKDGGFKDAGMNTFENL